jgi:tryptophanyl-tRNA synthetase
VENQDNCDALYFIADQHGLTNIGAEHHAQKFSRNRLSTAATFIASGIDPEKSTLFIQSRVPHHTELMWYLAAVARKGELERMTQWKTIAGDNQPGQSAALFAYPLLMAADILLYDAEQVPVGDDQRQHVEITRDWAERFNTYFGETFTMPQAMVPPAGARVKDLQRPTTKMSKSTSTKGAIFLMDSADVIHDKVMRATTDRGDEIFRSREKPGITNLLDIYCALTAQDPIETEHAFRGRTYRDLKLAVVDAIEATVEPIRQRVDHLMGDPAELGRLLDIGSERALTIADKTIDRARNAVGVG